MAKLVICRGLPGSGKTTFAQKWLREGGARCRINRDDIRANLFHMPQDQGVLDYEGEKLVTLIQQNAARAMLRDGVPVIIDDTNLRASVSRAWADLAHECGAEFEVVDFFNVDLHECLRRNAGRERKVPEHVIKGMYDRYGLKRGPLPAVVRTCAVVETVIDKYVRGPDLPEAVIFDIDGTLALMGDRGPFEWHKVDRDMPNHWVMNVCEALADSPYGYKIICLSGRDEVCRVETLEWLARWGVPHCELFMRPQGDNRKDSVVKSELFWNKIAPKYNVMCVFDDRDQVVNMWRDMGIGCAQVAPGNF